MVVSWMAAVLLGVAPGEEMPAVAATPPAGPTAASAAEQPLVEPRKGAELRTAVRAALKQWARPTDQQADYAARVFLVLYQELEQDDELAPTQRKELRQKVRGRLMFLAGRIETRRAVERRLARQDQNQPDSIDPAEHPVTLGQVGGGFGAMGGQGGFGGMGGAGMGMGPQPGGNPMVGDASGDLIELIQRTIAPASWDVNGGPGAIYYFRPQHSMVISNTEEVHEQVGDVLDQLRRAGN